MVEARLQGAVAEHDREGHKTVVAAVLDALVDHPDADVVEVLVEDVDPVELDVEPSGDHRFGTRRAPGVLREAPGGGALEVAGLADAVLEGDLAGAAVRETARRDHGLRVPLACLLKSVTVRELAEAVHGALAVDQTADRLAQLATRHVGRRLVGAAARAVPGDRGAAGRRQVRSGRERGTKYADGAGGREGGRQHAS